MSGDVSSVGYLMERRRALMRARAVVKKAPAVPKTARMAVGFSGEVTQPSWACSGRATAKRARPIYTREDFFIGGSPFGEGIGTTSI